MITPTEMWMIIFLVFYVPLTFFEIRRCRAITIKQEARCKRLNEELNIVILILGFSNRLHKIVREVDSKKALELLLDIRQSDKCYEGLSFEKRFYSNFENDILLVFNLLASKKSSGGELY